MKRQSKSVSSDVFMVIASLLMAFVVWLIAKEAELDQVSLEVPIRVVEIPSENLRASIYRETFLPISTVQVSLSVPKTLVSQLLPEQLALEMTWSSITANPDDWKSTTELQKEVSLEPSMVILSEFLSEDLKDRIRNSINILSVEPRVVTVRGRYITRAARLNVNTRGLLAKGYELTGPPTQKMDPPRILQVTASDARFMQLGVAEMGEPLELRTQPVSIAGRNESFTTITQVILPEDVEMSPGLSKRIQVEIQIRELQITKKIPNVEVVILPSSANLLADIVPKRVTVSLSGPQSVVKEIVASDLVAQPVTAPKELVGEEQTVTLQVLFSSAAISKITPEVKIDLIEPQGVKVTLSESPSAFSENVNE